MKICFIQLRSDIWTNVPSGLVMTVIVVIWSCRSANTRPQYTVGPSVELKINFHEHVVSSSGIKEISGWYVDYLG